MSLEQDKTATAEPVAEESSTQAIDSTPAAAKAPETTSAPAPTESHPEKESLHTMKELVNDTARQQMDNVGNDDEFDIAALTIEEALAKFNTNRNGLTSGEAAARLEKYGPNALPEKVESKLMKFLAFMWNPLSWVMEAAAIVAIVLSNGPQPYLFPNDQWAPYDSGTPYEEGTSPPPDYPDFIGIVLLLVANSCIGYYEESKAGDAVAALMDQLSPECKAKRDGQWVTIAAKELVPGDIVTIKLGDIIPADMKVLEGEPLKVDQAGLTGESLPVTKEPGDEVYSSSVVKRGEIDCMVHATGLNTFFGKAANLVSETEEHGHLQQVLSAIGLFCMSYIALWVVIVVIVTPSAYTWYYRGIINVVLVLLIGGIPIAMPTVLSVTMALGVNELAKQDAIVTRITAVEEMAGMDVLCSDKTGTLTLNQLTVDTPSTCGEFSASEVIRAAALAAKREGDPDAIDKCIAEAAIAQGLNFDDFEMSHFFPFDPVGKRTQATLKHKANGNVYVVSKGAPQVMIDLAWNADEIRGAQEKQIEDFALRGLRAIGVAEKHGEDGKWEFMGLIPLLDPPRHDTKQTIDEAQRLGVAVKMITGDQVAIGKETARRLGMGLNFHNAKILRQEFVEGIPIVDIVEEADGFGEVFPEDKYRAVEILRASKRGPFGGNHIVGMTGDGVNDAPALKAADMGVAMGKEGTDVAREAAEMILADDNFATIVRAVKEGRAVWDNLRKVLLFNTPVNNAQGMTVLFGIVCGLEFSPLTPIQVLYCNLICAVTLGFVLAVEVPEDGIMSLPPRRVGKRLIGRFLLLRIIIGTVTLVATTVGSVFIMRSRTSDYLIDDCQLAEAGSETVFDETTDCFKESVGQLRSQASNTLTFGAISVMLSARFTYNTSFHPRIFRGNKYAWYSVAIVVVLQICLTYIPGLNNIVFGMKPQNGVGWGFTILFMFVDFLVMEVEKAIRRSLKFRGIDTDDAQPDELFDDDQIHAPEEPYAPPASVKSATMHSNTIHH
mmetsp:Transcript_24246/g.38834  ORF Transcript_24246/g.38834 Transcript_24246/m.38834 type:complete len:1004 (-) Transcript_24246:206-3217(-)